MKNKKQKKIQKGHDAKLAPKAERAQAGRGGLISCGKGFSRPVVSTDGSFFSFEPISLRRFSDLFRPMDKERGGVGGNVCWQMRSRASDLGGMRARSLFAAELCSRESRERSDESGSMVMQLVLRRRGLRVVRR